MIIWWLRYRTDWKEKLRKSFFEIISNTKIFYINFFPMKLPTTENLLNLQGGLDKGGGTGQRRIR